MELGMIGLGRMGAYMSRRLMRAGHRSVVYDTSAEAIPAQVHTATLYQRFDSRGEASFADRVLSAMRFAFGGNLEKK